MQAPPNVRRQPHKLATLSWYRQPPSSVGSPHRPSERGSFFEDFLLISAKPAKLIHPTNNGSVAFLQKIYAESAPCLIRSKRKPLSPDHRRSGSARLLALSAAGASLRPVPYRYSRWSSWLARWSVAGSLALRGDRPDCFRVRAISLESPRSVCALPKGQPEGVVLPSLGHV
jgi:hypothetical protein